MKITSVLHSTLIVTACSLYSVGFAANADAAGLSNNQCQDTISMTCVDVELGLIIDGSTSVNNDKFNLQLDAYKNIFTSADFFQEFVAPLPTKRLVIGMVQFGTNAAQDNPYGLSWALIDSQEAATNFGNQFENIQKLNGFTNMGAAIELATNGILSNQFQGEHLVLDLASDGLAFRSRPAPLAASQNAALAGIDVLNAIAVPEDYNSLLDQLIFGKNLDGKDAFVVVAESLDNYEATLRDKLQREIVGKPNPNIPEPSSLLGLLAISFLGLAAKFKQSLRA